jgi:hypothetical protein
MNTTATSRSARRTAKAAAKAQPTNAALTVFAAVCNAHLPSGAAAQVLGNVEATIADAQADDDLPTREAARANGTVAWEMSFAPMPNTPGTRPAFAAYTRRSQKIERFVVVVREDLMPKKNSAGERKRLQRLGCEAVGELMCDQPDLLGVLFSADHAKQILDMDVQTRRAAIITILLARLGFFG